MEHEEPVHNGSVESVQKGFLLARENLQVHLSELSTRKSSTTYVLR